MVKPIVLMESFTDQHIPLDEDAADSWVRRGKADGPLRLRQGTFHPVRVVHEILKVASERSGENCRSLHCASLRSERSAVEGPAVFTTSHAAPSKRRAGNRRRLCCRT